MAMKLEIFYNKEIPKVDYNHICLAVISLDSTRKIHPQVFLKECKYIKKISIRCITQHIEIFASDSDEE